jgi:shikimate kinase
MIAKQKLAVQSLTRPIVLVGLMGVGKSTIGKRLAARLRVPFHDADHEIEQAAGLTVAEIFEKFGEAHFRDGERRVIARLLDGRPIILATGGGAFMNDATRSLILDKTIAVWIDADLDTLAERVARRDHRPLVRGKDARLVLGKLAEERNPIYALAPIHVRSERAPHDIMIDVILEKITCQT